MPLPGWNPITNVEPIFPDSHQCKALPGVNRVDCIEAAGYLPEGASPVPYTLGPTTNNPYHVPTYYHHGNCEVRIEMVGGAEPIRGRVSLIPDVIRGLAGYIIAECATPEGWTGGFATGGLSNMIQYILSPEEHPYGNALDPLNLNNLDPFPQTALFFTVTISSFTTARRTPDLDENIPLMLAAGIAKATTKGDISEKQVLAARDGLISQFLIMTENPGTPWYSTGHTGQGSGNSTAPLGDNDEMVYECDATLGNPSMVDCSQIEYSQLGLASDSVTIEPGSGGGKVFQQNTCRVDIVASVATVLTWGQIRAALDALLNMCMVSPLTKARGGRAFYGRESEQQLDNILNGWKRKKRSTSVNGLNALPPHVNVTVSAN